MIEMYNNSKSRKRTTNKDNKECIGDPSATMVNYTKLFFCGLLFSSFCGHAIAAKLAVRRSIDGFDFGLDPHSLAGPTNKSIDYTSINDPGFQLMLQIYHDHPQFAHELGYQWTGDEVICNCTDECNTPVVSSLFKLYDHFKTCVGIGCYKKVVLHNVDYEWVVDEHLGCLGQERSERVLDAPTPLAKCADLPYEKILCCADSYCNTNESYVLGNFSETLYFPVPKPEYPMLVEVSTILCILLAVLALMALMCVAVYIPPFSDYVRWLVYKCCPTVKRNMKNEEMLLARSSKSSEQESVAMKSLTSSARSNGARQPLLRPGGRFVALQHGPNDNPDSSGSGAGNACLNQRTLSWQVKLDNAIGEGRFGSVYKGQWRGQQVAIKVFSTRDEKSYATEVMLYEKYLLRHPNILLFIGSDTKDNGIQMELWMVTEYHHHGSLYEYLENNELTVTLLLQMTRSLAHGLAYLHMEIPGTKPKIAHRDIKSKNVLIKKDLTVCLADLGLSALFVDETIQNAPENPQSGTIRYLSPEVLSCDEEIKVFDNFMWADIYSMGLVIWEMTRRTHCEEGPAAVFEESIPYYLYVDRDPDLEDMKRVVYDWGVRPECSPFWIHNEILSTFISIISECLNETPSKRISAGYIRVKMDNITKKNEIHIEK